MKTLNNRSFKHTLLLLNMSLGKLQCVDFNLIVFESGCYIQWVKLINKIMLNSQTRSDHRFFSNLDVDPKGLQLRLNFQTKNSRKNQYNKIQLDQFQIPVTAPADKEMCLLQGMFCLGLEHLSVTLWMGTSQCDGLLSEYKMALKIPGLPNRGLTCGGWESWENGMVSELVQVVINNQPERLLYA